MNAEKNCGWLRGKSQPRANRGKGDYGSGSRNHPHGSRFAGLSYLGAMPLSFRIIRPEPPPGHRRDGRQRVQAV